MGFHSCPIEPDDWTNGPSYLDGEDCDECAGTGTVPDEDGFEHTCEECNGAGWIGPDEPDYDPTDVI